MGSGQRKTAGPTLDLVRHLASFGRELLLLGAFDGLRSVVGPSPIATRLRQAEAGGKGAGKEPSRDTVYKGFREPPDQNDSPDSRWATYVKMRRKKDMAVADAAVLATAVMATDPIWAGSDESLNKVADAWAAKVEPRARLVAAVTANIEHQLESPGFPVGWILHAAALTSSTLWRGPKPASPDDRTLGRALLEIRRDQLSLITDKLDDFMDLAMSELRLQPEHGVESRTVLILMNALMDGAILRMMVDPDALDVGLIAEAMVRLGESFGRPGAAGDPRRRMVDGDLDDTFDAMVAAAADLWASELTSVQAVADSWGGNQPAIDLFPDQLDLAESVIWYLVGRGAPTDPRRATSKPAASALLSSTLQQLREAAESHPLVLTLIASSGRSGVLDHLRASIAADVRHITGRPDSGELANELLDAAIEGERGLNTVKVIDRLAGLGLAL